MQAEKLLLQYINLLNQLDIPMRQNAILLYTCGSLQRLTAGICYTAYLIFHSRIEVHRSHQSKSFGGNRAMLSVLSGGQTLLSRRSRLSVVDAKSN